MWRQISSKSSSACRERTTIGKSVRGFVASLFFGPAPARFLPDFFHAAESPGVARDAFIPKSAQRIAFSRVQLAPQSAFKQCLADDFALRGVLAGFNGLLDKFSQSGLRVDMYF
jgi:hypothetical protein